MGPPTKEAKAQQAAAAMLYDTQTNELFKTWLAGHRLDECVGKDGILFIGPMGSGKSTLIAIMLGAQFRLVELPGVWDEKLDQITETSHQLQMTHMPKGVVPRIGHNYTSQTVNIGAYPDPTRSNLVYIDSAGDVVASHNANQQKYTRFSVQVALGVVKEIKAVVICIDGAGLLSNRGEGMYEVAQALADIAGDINAPEAQCFLASAVFVFTNPFFKGRAMSARYFHQQTRLMLHDKMATVKGQLKKLARSFPVQQTMRQHAANAAAGAASAGNKLAAILDDTEPAEPTVQQLMAHYMRKIDMQKFKTDLGEHEVHEVKQMIDTCTLLQAMVDAGEERMMTAYPDDANACTKIRQDVTRLTANAGRTRMGRTEIDRFLRSTTDHKFDMATTFGSILNDVGVLNDVGAPGIPYGSLFQYQAKRLEALAALKDVMVQNKSTIRRIDHDWRSQKSEMIYHNQQTIDQLERSILHIENEVERLQTSTKYETAHVWQIRRERYKGFWSFSAWFGYGSFDGELEHTMDGHEPPPHLETAVYNENMTQIKKQNENQVTGFLKVHASSTSGFDAHADVDFKKMEKDLVATKQRIELKQASARDKEAVRETLMTNVSRLRIAQNKAELLSAVSEVKEELEEQIGEDMVKLATLKIRPLDNPHAPTDEAALWSQIDGLNGLYTLLKLLHGHQLLPTNLPQATRDTIEEFLDAVSGANQLEQELKPYKDLLKPCKYGSILTEGERNKGDNGETQRQQPSVLAGVNEKLLNMVDTFGLPSGDMNEVTARNIAVGAGAVGCYIFRSDIVSLVTIICKLLVFFFLLVALPLLLFGSRLGEWFKQKLVAARRTINPIDTPDVPPGAFSAQLMEMGKTFATKMGMLGAWEMAVGK